MSKKVVSAEMAANNVQVPHTTWDKGRKMLKFFCCGQLLKLPRSCPCTSYKRRENVLHTVCLKSYTRATNRGYQIKFSCCIEPSFHLAGWHSRCCYQSNRSMHRSIGVATPSPTTVVINKLYNSYPLYFVFLFLFLYFLCVKFIYLSIYRPVKLSSETISKKVVIKRKKQMVVFTRTPPTCIPPQIFQPETPAEVKAR